MPILLAKGALWCLVDLFAEVFVLFRRIAGGLEASFRLICFFTRTYVRFTFVTLWLLFCHSFGMLSLFLGYVLGYFHDTLPLRHCQNPIHLVAKANLGELSQEGLP